ncbi:hypothetical protein PHMEG_00019359 [Phytophthora megakarya]|uniref:Uncharacterized protein n=1 Tax=Phytophthora megakarya TaxID=4795 RepID=A0A225VT94_9STRA|nr:hypothetical protein PHMEG_00019359 [Phytophthora megakarya]
MTSNDETKTLNRLVFPKDVMQFGVWKDLIVGHLRLKSTALAREAMLKGQNRPAFNDQDCYIRSLLSQTLPRGYLESLRTSFNDEDLPVAWKRLEAHYGQSNAQGMAALVAEFDKALEMDFSSVGQLIYAATKVLSLFSSQYWGNNVDYTSEGFHLDKVEALLRNVFMDKSKSQIQAMQARIVPANYVASHRPLGKRQWEDEPKKKGVNASTVKVGTTEMVKLTERKKGPKKKAKPMREEIPADVALMQPISKVEVAAVVKGTPQEPEPGYGTTLTSEQAQQDADELMTSPPPSPTPSSSSSAMSDDENDMDECEQGYFPSHSVKLSEASSKIK